MFVDEVPNRKFKPTVLLRDSKRINGKPTKKTLANISHWPPGKIDALKKLLKDEPMTTVNSIFTAERTLPHGNVILILKSMEKLNISTFLSSRHCKESDIIQGLIAERLLFPTSKLASFRLWNTTSLSEELKLKDITLDDLYKAMDWLVKRQGLIEKKLSERHLKNGATVLYDVTSSYYHGHTCSLAQYGYNRDKKRGTRSIVYGVMTNGSGCPVAVQVYEGNTSDTNTVADQIEKLRKNFELERVVLTGDRGMLTQTNIEELKEYEGIGWLSALRNDKIKKLVEAGNIQLSVFDSQDIAEIESEDYPGERLIVCYNPLLAEDRKKTREELLSETEKRLEGIRKQVLRRKKKSLTAGEIGKKIGKVLGKYKMGKHYFLEIKDGEFTYERNWRNIEKEQNLDGIYVIRTSEPKERMSQEDAVRNYKSLSQVERLFRTLKGIDIRVRPIFHREALRVKAHIFLCMLAYYVEWHMRNALKEVLFDDEELEENRSKRNPVRPAKCSVSAQRKKKTKKTASGFDVHSFDTLLAEMGTLCKIKYKMMSEISLSIIGNETDATPFQKHVLRLIEMCPVI